MACRHDEDDLIKLKPIINTGNKGGVRGFGLGLLVVAFGLLSISETSDLLGLFSHKEGSKK